VTNGSQNIVVSYVYEGFGKIVGQNGGGGGPYQFCGLWGYRNDQDAGLLHVGARYYEIETGRWVQKDKWLGNILNPQTLNKYIYAINSSNNLIDENGNRISLPKCLDVTAVQDMIINLPKEGGPGGSSDPWYEDIMEAIIGIVLAAGGIALIVAGASGAIPIAGLTTSVVIAGSGALAVGVSKVAIEIADIFADW
jgi:RHS repeat-associated protein